jgi:hypothetical protein
MPAHTQSSVRNQIFIYLPRNPWISLACRFGPSEILVGWPSDLMKECARSFRANACPTSYLTLMRRTRPSLGAIEPAGSVVGA